MRPTGVALIALYHFLGAVLLAVFAVGAVVGGSVLGAMFGGLNAMPMSGMGLGFAFGVLGAMFLLFWAGISGVAGYGVWAMREWGRILSIVLSALSLLFSLPGLLFMGLHLNLFFGTYRLFRIAVSILIIWYLVQPEIKVLFQRAAPASPQS